MKKTALAALLSALILVSACDDKSAELNTKLQQAEQQISALNAQLTKTQENLNQTKQAEAEMIPALNVEIYPLFSKQEKFKLKKNADDASLTEAGIYYFFSLPKTGLDWLDQFFVQQLVEEFHFDEEKTADSKTRHPLSLDELKAQIEKFYQANVASLKEDELIGISYSLETSYLGQRDNIATFSQFFFNYNGGAHGLYKTDYFNIDLAKKALISLDMLVPKQNQAKLKDLLWEAYGQRNLDQTGESNGAIQTVASRDDFELPDNFYFSQDGIMFSYPLYTLDSVLVGAVKLELAWNKINPLLSPDYQRTKKDGFGLAPEDSYR